MKILEYRWKNFNSYGNIEHSIEFNENNQLILVSGTVGSGKSSINEVLEFNIFGKVGQKKLSDLTNRINHCLESYSKIETSAGILEITRNYHPTIFEVYLDGQLLSDIAGKKNVQAQIETEILNIDKFMFKNLISLDVNKFKSFVKMSKSERKMLIDRIFGLDIINKMYVQLKEEVKENRQQESNIKNTIEKLEENLNFTTLKVAEIRKKIEEKQAKESNTYQQDLITLQKQRQEVDAKFKKLKVEINNITAKKNHTEQILAGVIHDIKNTQKKIKLYAQNTTCPTCGSDFSSTEHLESKRIHEAEEVKLLEVYNLANTELKDFKAKLLKFSDISNQGHKKLAHLDNEIRHVLLAISKIKENSEDIQIETLLEVIKKSDSNINSEKDDLLTVNANNNFLGILDIILSENGIKRHMLQQIIPHLNKEINTTLTKIDLGYSLELDEALNSKVFSYGRELGIETLSTGEGKKFDFAVLISFIKLIKTKFHQNNLLFLDEIFSSLDMDSVDMVCTMLKDVSIELNLHVFLINHSLLDSILFDKVIEVSKDKHGFSKIKQL